MPSFNGIYENGVVRFPGPVDIPEGAKVTVVAIDASPTQPPLRPSAAIRPNSTRS
jgi:predicted DNA-binding antitoxin AbrB/MazE fold protein